MAMCLALSLLPASVFAENESGSDVVYGNYGTGTTWTQDKKGTGTIEYKTGDGNTITLSKKATRSATTPTGLIWRSRPPRPPRPRLPARPRPCWCSIPPARWTTAPSVVRRITTHPVVSIIRSPTGTIGSPIILSKLKRPVLRQQKLRRPISLTATRAIPRAWPLCLPRELCRKCKR